MSEPITVVIPAYDEEPGIGDVIEQVKSVLTEAQIAHEIIVVDDGSTDETSSIAQHCGARVIQHAKNRGYGAALKTGIDAAGHESIVIMDADGTYPVDQTPKMLEELRRADMVVGARVKRNAAIPFLRRPARWVLRRLAEYVTGERIPDVNSGLRVFRRKLAQQYFSLLPDGFSFTTTITMATLCDDYKITYVPIDYYPRVGKSKIVPWDFASFVTLVLRLSMLFRPLKVFAPVAGILGILGVLKLIWDIASGLSIAPEFSWRIIGPGAISTSAVLLLLAGLSIGLVGALADLVMHMIPRTHSSPPYQSAFNAAAQKSRGGARGTEGNNGTRGP